MEQAERHPHPNYWVVWLGLALLTVAELYVAKIAFWSKTTVILLLVFLRCGRPWWRCSCTFAMRTPDASPGGGRCRSP
jgi:hypothetical protein